MKLPIEIVIAGLCAIGIVWYIMGVARDVLSDFHEQNYSQCRGATG